jgi:hypothetical protein
MTDSAKLLRILKVYRAVTICSHEVHFFRDDFNENH